MYCSSSFSMFIINNHPYIAVEIVLTSVSSATFYVGMIVNICSQVMQYVAAIKLLVLCTLSDSDDTILLFVDFL